MEKALKGQLLLFCFLCVWFWSKVLVQKGFWHNLLWDQGCVVCMFLAFEAFRCKSCFMLGVFALKFLSLAKLVGVKVSDFCCKSFWRKKLLLQSAFAAKGSWCEGALVQRLFGVKRFWCKRSLARKFSDLKMCRVQILLWTKMERCPWCKVPLASRGFGCKSFHVNNYSGVKAVWCKTFLVYRSFGAKLFNTTRLQPKEGPACKRS